MATCKEEGASEIVDEEYRKECSHYSRGCSFVSPCCGGVYPCRLCHDDKVMSHQIDRHSVMEVVCRKCSKRQPVGRECVQCGLVFGRYFCAVCRLYDDADKGQYHCDQCGICRVGGRENFYHCERCGFCLAVTMRDSHTCRRQMSRDNCPVCMEDIHTSRTAAHVPNCGHLLHTTCYQEMLRKGLYQCPQCQTSLGDMNWKLMDSERDAWELPQHLQNFQVKVSCRDCHKETDTNFHVVGFKCGSCGSYNTVRCGTEELPEDPNPAPGGLAGIVRRIVGGRGNQGGQDVDDEENDSSSSSESGDNESSDSESDGDRGGSGPGNPGELGNQQQPDDTRPGDDHHHDDSAAGGAPSGESPSSRFHDDGEVDDDSYDGDESDYEEDESVSSESSEEFFDCSNRFQSSNFQFSPRQRQNNRRIKSQAKNPPEWWESDGENESNIVETRLIRTASPVNHTCHHSRTRSRKPHPPIQVMAEQLHVMDIWGSDYFSDSFSDMSSENTDEEDTGFEGMNLARRKPALINQTPEISEIDTPQNLTRMYSKSPSLTVPIQNGLHTQCACPYPQNTVRSCDTRVTSDWLQTSTSQPTWTRKSSSEESWATANEEFGTLV